MENLKQFTDEEWQRMSNQLQKQLGPEYLAQRPGPSGRPLTYIEGKTAINIANDIFGFNGWSTDIKDTTIDFVRQFFFLSFTCKKVLSNKHNVG